MSLRFWRDVQFLIPKSHVNDWSIGLSAIKGQVRLFDRDPEAIEIVRRSVPEHNWAADYWAENNYGGIVQHERSVVWVSIPRAALFPKTRFDDEFATLLVDLLPVGKWWRSRADRKVLANVKYHLKSLGMIEWSKA